ncbi:MAG: FHA domain-containing protein, partial [Limisphaerales bacterium]
MRVHLEAMPMLVSKGSDGAQIQLKPGINRFGRNASNDVQVQDTSISGTHCEVIVEDETVRVRDLDSTNGTFVDEFRVRESFLHEGQTLRLGSCAYCFVPNTIHAPTAVRLKQPAPPAPLPTPAESLPLPPVAPGVKTCANHQSRAAAFVCKKCGGHFCDSCINEQTIAHRKLRFCRACGEECISLRESAPQVKRAPTFFEMLPHAFLYPLKRDGLIMLVSGTVFFGFLDAIVGGPHMGGFFVGANVLIVQLFALGYLIAYMKAIV